MRAVLVSRPGGPDALECVDLPIPNPGPHEVQIRAEAIGVGHPDILIRSGVYKWMPPLPVNPGNDLAGRITAVGSDVTDITVGTKVLLSARDLPQRGGCYAEYVVVPADAVHLLDETIDLEQAACLANYQVASALLKASGHRPAGDAVLVIGAAGGVGSALVQLAKRDGLTVIGTVSTDAKAEFARRNGADHVIFYRREDVVARTRDLTGGGGVGIVFDHVGGAHLTDYFAALGRWGTLVSYNAFTPLPENNVVQAMRANIDNCPGLRCFNFHIYDHDREGRRGLLRDVISALGSGEIRPEISVRLKLSEVRRAHELLEEGAAPGKIIMTP